MVNQQKGSELAVIVHVDFPGQDETEELAEFYELVKSAGAIPVVTIISNHQ